MHAYIHTQSQGDIVNAALNALSNLASHNPSRPRILATPGVAQVTHTRARTHTHTHTHTYICVCMCVCVYIYIYLYIGI